MGALGNVKVNLKESKLGQMFGETFRLLFNMVNSEGEVEQTVEEAVEETKKSNPEVAQEVEKFVEIDKISKKVLEEKEKKQFDTSKTFGEDSGNYKEIDNKLTGIKAEISEKSAIKNRNEKEKSDRQRTRVDED